MNNKFTRIYLFATLIIALASCGKENKEDKPILEDNKVEEKIPGIVLDNMDTLVNPKNDFYNYVNGNWMKNTKIPDDRTRWGGFGVLRKKTDNDVLDILDKAKSNPKYKDDTDQGKAILLFESILDIKTRQEQGITPLTPVLEKIKEIKNIKDLQKVIALEPAVTAPFMGLVAFPNLSNSSINAPYIAPGQLGLPEREYYLDQDQKSKEIREKYKMHIAKMMQYIGQDSQQALKSADIVLEIETKLAKERLDKEQSRDTRNFNNPTTIDELKSLTPAIDWKQFFEDIKVKKELQSVIVMEPNYMKALQEILVATSLEDLKTMVIWSTLNQVADWLSTDLEKENWNFYESELKGAIKQRPINERALATVNGAIGEALGRLYVEKKFPPEAKIQAEKMVDNIIKAFKRRIDKLEWMGDTTKIKAIEKLDRFTVKIGYPNVWEDYGTMKIKKSNSFFDNMIAVTAWQTQNNIDEIGKPVDKTEWGMYPQTVNAYFNPILNEIVFPAAILQPPFYNYTADEAVNYGGIGAVIGHEISHAFDDSGARYDANGNLNNWWTKNDLNQFAERKKALADQYSAIEVLEGVFINGEYTLGENIGDLGGILGAYDGLQVHLLNQGRPEDIDGFTPEQRFFMSWATVWRTKIREEALRTQIKTDKHSPGAIRAIQPLLNIQYFYDAFDIQEGNQMYLAPENRVHIW